MIVKQISNRPVAEVDARLREAAARYNFGILGVHDLQATLEKKGFHMPHACLVYEVCNPYQAQKALNADGSLSAALPCRISMYTSPEGTVLSTIRPSAMIAMFHKPELGAMAEEVESVILAMMREAA